MFKLSEESLEKEEKRRVTEVCREIIGIELKGLEEERGIVKELCEKIVEWTKKKEEKEQVEERDSSRGEGARGLSSVNSVRENSSVRSEGGESAGSSLSAREVEKIRRWVTDKNREDKKRSIMRMPREVGNDRKKCVEWVPGLIKDELCVDAKMMGCRESGAVVVVRLENEEEKKEVMQNKFRLKGESIFIENDLS